MSVVLSVTGDSLSHVLYRHFGRENDTLEAELVRLNPSLPLHGPVLPGGVVLQLPPLDFDVVKAVVTKPIVNIWD